MKILRTQSPFKESNPPAKLNFLGFFYLAHSIPLLNQNPLEPAVFLFSTMVATSPYPTSLSRPFKVQHGHLIVNYNSSLTSGPQNLWSHALTFFHKK
jgi:hypothetical protein